MPSYPSSTLDGAGLAKVWLLAGGAFGRTAILTLPSFVSGEFSYEPERTDGGDVVVALDDRQGTLIERAHGFRPRFTYTWSALTATQARALRRIINHLAGGGIVYFQPSVDVLRIYRVIREPNTHKVGHPGGLYLGHDLTETLVGVNVMSRIPLEHGDGQPPVSWKPLILMS